MWAGLASGSCYLSSINLFSQKLINGNPFFSSNSFLLQIILDISFKNINWSAL